VILSSFGLRFKRWHYLQQLHETKPPDDIITQAASAELFITATATMLEQTNKSSQKTDKNAADIGLNPIVDLLWIDARVQPTVQFKADVPETPHVWTALRW
tara:strand:+ start:3698 stop:4000 length:303 start_codon:yes stop_codon:yes gene_type:complete